MHATSCPVASKIIAGVILLFRNATTENRSVNWTTVNFPRGAWGQEAMSNPHLGCGDAWGWGVGHEIDKCITDSNWVSDSGRISKL